MENVGGDQDSLEDRGKNITKDLELMHI